MFYLEVENPYLDSACVTDFRIFLVLILSNQNVFLPEEQRNVSFRLANPSTDGRKLHTLPMHSYLYSNSYGISNFDTTNLNVKLIESQNFSFYVHFWRSDPTRFGFGYLNSVRLFKLLKQIEMQCKNAKK